MVCAMYFCVCECVFVYLLMSVLEIVQYNLETPGSTVQTMCDVMTGGSDAYAMYAKLQQ